MGNPSLKGMKCPFCHKRLTVFKYPMNDKYSLICNNKECPFVVRTKEQFKTASDAKNAYYEWQMGVAIDGKSK